MKPRTSLPLHPTENGKPKRKARKLARAEKKVTKAINSEKFARTSNTPKQDKRADKKVSKAFSKRDKTDIIYREGKAAYKKYKKGETPRVKRTSVKNAKSIKHVKSRM